MFVDIELSAYMPDRGGAPHPEDPGYLVDAENVRPTPNGYMVQPLNEDVASGTAATETVLEGVTIRENGWLVVGGSSVLEISSDTGQTWSNVSRTTAYSTPSDWDFALFDEHLIACSSANEPQEKSTNDAVGTLFADLAGGPPKAAYCARVRDHLVLGNLDEGTGNDERIVAWSSIGNPEDWPTAGSASALAFQSGRQEMSSDLGEVRGLIGGEKFGIVFQEGGITRMTYVGGDVQYRFDIFEKEEGLQFDGTNRPHGPVWVNGITYFMTLRGVFATDGYTVKNLSLGSCVESIFADRYDHPDGGIVSTSDGVYDPIKQQIIWTYLIGGSVRRGLIYSIPLNRFASISFAGSNVDTLVGGVLGAGVTPGPFCFVTSSKILQTFTDITAIEIAIQTGYIELAPGRRVQITGAHLYGANIGTPTMGIKVADDYANVDIDQDSFTAMTAPAREILFNARKTGRFVAFRITGTQNADAVIKGIRIYYEGTSAR